MQIEKVADYFLPILGEKMQPHTIARTLQLLDLESEIQESIHFGRIGEKLGLELHQLIPDDRLKLHQIFLHLELGGGKQKRLLELTKDLAFGKGKTISTLLAEPDFTLIFEHPEMNRPQQASALLTLLQKKLFPESSAAEEAFQRAVDTLRLPSTCTVKHSPAFEKDEILVTMRFQTLEQIKDRLQDITALTEPTH